ncbi:hypothetical protein ACIBCH_42005 [Amycolatopsis thailandensis]|uniref:hypothetical protein n=1 Tax=Amycolatopsis thailandensis TaxID=589330 RepID=UPI0037A966D8
MNDRYAELRRQYPNLPDAYWDSLAKQDAIRDELNALREGLAYLIGFHQDAGTVPLDEIRALLTPGGAA